MSKFVVYEEMTVRMSEWEFKGYENGVRHYFDSRRRALDYAEDQTDKGRALRTNAGEVRFNAYVDD